MPNTDSAAVRSPMTCLRSTGGNETNGVSDRNAAGQDGRREPGAGQRRGNHGRADGAAPSMVEPLEAAAAPSVSHDAGGWTVVTPGSGSRVVYVSSSQGSDSNSGLSQKRPGAVDRPLLKSCSAAAPAISSCSARGRPARDVRPLEAERAIVVAAGGHWRLWDRRAPAAGDGEQYRVYRLGRVGARPGHHRGRAQRRRPRRRDAGRHPGQRPHVQPAGGRLQDHRASDNSPSRTSSARSPTSPSAGR